MAVGNVDKGQYKGGISLNDTTISDLATAIVEAGGAGSANVAVTNFPTDYPDASAEGLLTSILGEVGDIDTQIEDINTNLGTDGATPPTIPGTGVRGWLRSIYDKLSGTLTVDGSAHTQPVSASTLPLPTGAATSSAQAAAQVSLSSLDTKVTAVNTGAVVVSSSSLPTGAATSAAQTTGNASLSSIDGKITSVNTGAVVISSSALPTGAATSAKQDTGNTSVASIDTKTPSLGQALAAASTPVVLTAAQVTTLTPPAQPTDFPSTGANTKLDTLHTDLGHLTDSTQKAVITDGTQIANTMLGDTGFNGLSTSLVNKEWIHTFSGTDTQIIDTRGFSHISIQTALTGLYTVTFNESNDNTNFWLKQTHTYDGLVTTNKTASGIVSAVLSGRYFRISGAGSGSMVVTVELSNKAASEGLRIDSVISTVSVIVSGTPTVLQGNGTGTSAGWCVGGTGAGLSNSASTSVVAGATLSYAAAQSIFGMQVVVGGTGSFTALSVIIEGSLDGGTTWVTIGTYTGTGSGYFSNTTPMPFIAVRSRVSVYTAASGTPTVTCRIAGIN